MEVKDPQVEDPSAKGARSSSASHPVASVSQSIANLDQLSTIPDFVRRVGVDVESAETKEEI